MQRKPGAQSLLRAQAPAPHKPPVQTFPQPSKPFLLQVVTAQGAEAPDEPLPVAVVPEPAVVPALLIVPALPPAAPEPLPAAMPDPAGPPSGPPATQATRGPLQFGSWLIPFAR